MSTFKYDNLPESQEKEYSDLWDWFLTNINEGNFELITKNVIMLRKLDQFITNFAQNYNSNLFILLLPTEKLHKSPYFLIDILSKFYHDNDINHHVTITPMGQIKKLQASIILVKDDHALCPKAFQSLDSEISQSLDMVSVISGEAGYAPSVVKENEEFAEEEEEVEQSIMSNEDVQESLGASLRRVQSVSQSIYDDDDNDDDDESHSQLHVEFQEESCESSIASSEISGQLSELQPFPTRISSISSGLDSSSSLILKTILLKDIQGGELKTAIRQINNEESSDDWLLYDSRFSLDNLQLLKFSEIFDYGGHLKILFYSLESQEVHELSSDQESLNDDDDLLVMKFDGRDDHAKPITFTTSQNTTLTTPINILSKTSTLKTVTHESIKSESMVHKPDSTFSGIMKSKSEPVNSHIKKLRMKKKQSKLNDKSCVIM